MKVRLTNNEHNTYTIYTVKEVAIGRISYNCITHQWVASIYGEIIATGNFSFIIHTLTV